MRDGHRFGSVFSAMLRLRDVKVYPVIRELHLKREAEGISEGCVRLVNVIMRDEETGVVKEDEDRKIEEVF